MSAGIAITGAGVVTPLGAGAGALARHRAGERAAGRIAELPLAELPDVVRARAARAERVSQLLLAAATPALAAAGLAESGDAPRPDIGVVVGTAFGCFLSNAAFAQRIAEAGPAAGSPRVFAATVSNAAAGELAIAYRLGGPCVTLTAGGAAGLTALGHACDLLRDGQAAALVAGGVDAVGEALVDFLAAGGLASDHPPSEGAAVVVLETVEHAARRGAGVLGTIEGYAGGFQTVASGDGEGLAAAIRAAVAEAGIDGWVPPIVRDPKASFGETFGAAGPLALLAALGEVPPGAAVLVVDVCRSGHVAALVARRGATA